MNRIQRKRTKGFKLPEGTICITRGTKWGNPMKVRPWKGTDFGCIYVQDFTDRKLWHRTNFYGTVPDMLVVFKKMMEGVQFGDKHLQVWSGYLSKLDLSELEGHDLACFCKEGKPCHGDVYIELLNKNK